MKSLFFSSVLKRSYEYEKSVIGDIDYLNLTLRFLANFIFYDIFRMFLMHFSHFLTQFPLFVFHNLYKIILKILIVVINYRTY